MTTPFDAPDWRSMSQQDRDLGLNNGVAVAGSADIVAGWERRSADMRARHAEPSRPPIRPARAQPHRLSQSPPTTAPTLLFIHGGYWQTRAKEIFALFAEGPMAHGINVALIGYTLAPDATLDADRRRNPRRDRFPRRAIARARRRREPASSCPAGPPAGI